MPQYKVRPSNNILKCPICNNSLFNDISQYLGNKQQHVIVCTYCSYHLNFGIEFNNIIKKLS